MISDLNHDGSFEGICEVTESTLRVVVNNVSKLEKRICSPSSGVVLRGIPFQVLVEPIADKVKRHTSLGIFLECDYAQKDPEWSCKVGMEITLVTQKKDGKSIDFGKREFEYTFRHNSATSWGFPSFILWSKLVDPLNGFVVDDKMILIIKVRAEPPEGIQRRHLHNMEIFVAEKSSTKTEVVVRNNPPELKSEAEDEGQEEESDRGDLDTSKEEEKADSPASSTTLDPVAKFLQQKNEVVRTPAQEEKLRRAIVDSVIARRKERATPVVSEPSKPRTFEDMKQIIRELRKTNLESHVPKKESPNAAKKSSKTYHNGGVLTVVDDPALWTPATDAELAVTRVPNKKFGDYYDDLPEDENETRSSDDGFEYLA